MSRNGNTSKELKYVHSLFYGWSGDVSPGRQKLHCLKIEGEIWESGIGHKSKQNNVSGSNVCGN